MLKDRYLVWVLFVVLAVLSLATIVGNNDAKTASLRAEKAATKASNFAVEAKIVALETLRLREKSDRCLVEAISTPEIIGIDLRYQACLDRS